MTRVLVELDETKVAISNVEKEISRVELMLGKQDLGAAHVRYLRTKEEQLRKEKEQLRKKEELLLERALPAAQATGLVGTTVKVRSGPRLYRMRSSHSYASTA